MNQRHVLAYVLLPIIQRECDKFVDLWNSHMIRSQNNLELPNGVPNHMFSFPEQYGETQNGISVTNEFLQEVSTQSGLSIDNESTMYDFMDEEFLRLLSAIFYQIFIFSPYYSPSKTMKSVFYFI